MMGFVYDKEEGVLSITMDDEYLPMRLLLFAGLIVLEAGLYGFGAAIQTINIGKLEQDMEAGNKKAARLLRVVNRPSRFVHVIYIVTHLAGMIAGAYILTVFPVYPAAFFAAALFLLISLISFGIIVPKHCAVRKPEKWGYRLLPLIFFHETFFPLNCGYQRRMPFVSSSDRN